MRISAAFRERAIAGYRHHVRHAWPTRRRDRKGVMPLMMRADEQRQQAIVLE
jgi:hypothetical protein